MVFGNGGGRSGASVAFTRNPATGAKELYADFLIDAQGEDVVSGRRRPSDWNVLATKLPEVAIALVRGGE
jgi:pyruvate, orthophosphate dikinase